ncbi:MAG: YIP1 family protein [Rubrobacteraceae bacterium]
MSIRAASGTSSGGDYDLQNPAGSFVDVVRRVVTQPAGFFSSIPRRGNYLSPLVFGLISITISTILGGLLRLAWGAQTGGGVRFQAEDYGFGDFILSVIFAPIGGAIGLFILAAIVHLLVMIFVGSGNSGFESTFRVVSYVSVTNLVNWIPFVGGIVALYGLYLAVVGIREIHVTTTGRAALVVLVPVAVVLFLVLLILLVAGAFLIGRFA